MNKSERTAAGKKVAARRAKDLGWKTPFAALPMATQVALKTTGDIRISHRSTRKHFPTRKDGYGHFSGHTAKGLPKRDLVERAIVRSHAPQPE